MTMTDHEDPIAFKRNDAPGFFYGVPNRDLTVREAAALPPDLRRDVEADLTPAQKAARTREANQAREDAEQAEAERRRAEADAAKQAADDETGQGDE
jgi:hypothetical protein